MKIDARMTLDETRWLLELAARHESIRGVVGYVEFLSPEVGSQIDEFKDHPKCVGMRHVVDHISKPLIRDGVLSPWDRHKSDSWRASRTSVASSPAW